MKSGENGRVSRSISKLIKEMTLTGRSEICHDMKTALSSSSSN